MGQNILPEIDVSTHISSLKGMITKFIYVT
jgi:hypothetical protein